MQYHIRVTGWILLKDVSVVISTYTKDRLNNVSNCINSLKKQTAMPCEIILVLDPDPGLIEYYLSRLDHEVEIVLSEEQGLSSARNAGVRKAHGEVVAFIDDDAVADNDWVKKLTEQYDDPLVFGVGGLVKPLWEGKRSCWFPEELDWIVGCSYKGLPQRKTIVRNPIGCNMSFRKDVFQKAGFFRTNIGRFGGKPLSGEEPEFSIRVLEAFPRARIIYDPSAVVYHHVPKERASLRYLLKRSFYEGLSKSIITSNNNSTKDLYTEDAYIKYLLGVTLPSKLKGFYRMANLCHVVGLMASMLMVFAGFVTGKLQFVRSDLNE